MSTLLHIFFFAVAVLLLRAEENFRKNLDYRRYRSPFSSRDEAIAKFDTSSTPAGAGVYAITVPYYPDDREFLVQYNVQTGDIATVVPLNSQESISTGLSCLDNVNNVLYFLYVETITTQQGSQLVTGLQPFDLDSMEALAPILLPVEASSGLVGAGDACIGDPNTGDIYIWGHSNDSDVQLLIRLVRDVNQDTVSLTTVNQYTKINDLALGPGNPQAYDSARNMIWLAAEEGVIISDATVNYFYINALNGEIVTSVAYDDWPLLTAAYDPNLDVLVGWTANSEPQNFSFAYVDPVTLEIIKKFDPVVDYCGPFPFSAADVVNGVGYYLMVRNPLGACDNATQTIYGYLVSVDFSDGTIIDSPTICSETESTCPWSLQYWSGQ